jgi:hypothetical protein
MIGKAARDQLGVAEDLVGIGALVVVVRINDLVVGLRHRSLRLGT